MKVAALICLAVGAPVAFGIAGMIPMYGQILHASGPLPSFEVATIKPWNPTTSRPASNGISAPRKVIKAAPTGPSRQESDRVHFIGQAVILISSAYNLPVASGRQIVGGPEWLRQESDRYEVQAKIEDSLYAAMQRMTPAQQREQVALMEQSLLVDRFNLKVHFEARVMPVYALVVAKGGSRLVPANDDEPSKLVVLESEQGDEVTAKAVTLDTFVHSPLLRAGGRLVVDETGLKGAYDFTLKSAPYQPSTPAADADSAADLPALFTALREQLGLRLVSSKAQVEVLVIDHIDRPSLN